MCYFKVITFCVLMFLIGCSTPVDVKANTKAEILAELKAEITGIKTELKTELMSEIKTDMSSESDQTTGNTWGIGNINVAGNTVLAFVVILILGLYIANKRGEEKERKKSGNK